MRENRYRFFRTFIVLLLLIFNELCTGSKISGPNVCWKVVEGKRIPYCCFNYYLQDKYCQECKAGTTSTDGTVCLPCSPSWYGHKCKYRCSCDTNQRCNPEFGCLDLSSSGKVEILSHTPGNETMLTTIASETETNDTGTPILYFMLVATGLITWLIFCWTCSKYFYQKTRPERLATSQMTVQSEILQPVRIQQEQVNNECILTGIIDETKLVETRSQPRRLPVKSHHIYDSVDDIMFDISKEQQDVNSEDGNAASTQSINNVSCACDDSKVIKRKSYLNFYQQLKSKRETKVHDYIGMATSAEDKA